MPTAKPATAVTGPADRPEAGAEIGRPIVDRPAPGPPIEVEPAATDSVDFSTPAGFGEIEVVEELEPVDLAPPPAVSVLDRLAERVEWSDSAAEAATRDRLLGRAIPPGGLGRLGEVAGWLSSVQGISPPREPRRVRAVVFAADHGVSAAGVSVSAPGSTAARVAALRSGASLGAVLADVAGASVRVVDMGAGARIDRTDAMTAAQTVAAIETGARIADEEVDAGADLLIAGDLGMGSTTAAAVIVAVLTNTEPVKVVGRGSGIDDAAWSRKVAAIRDARRRGMDHRNDMTALLGSVGGPDVAALTGFLLGAAARRTPVILDGVVVGAAALVAREAAARVIKWWVAGHRSTEPAHALTLEQLPLEPLLDFRLAVGEGAGALLAVGVVRAAARAAADLPAAPAQSERSVAPGVGAPDDSADMALDERRLDQPGG